MSETRRTSNAELRRQVDSVTDPNVHSVTLRDMDSGQVLAIYRTEEEAARHALEHFKPGRMVEAVVWHPAKCEHKDVP